MVGKPCGYFPKFEIACRYKKAQYTLLGYSNAYVVSVTKYLETPTNLRQYVKLKLWQAPSKLGKLTSKHFHVCVTSVLTCLVTFLTGPVLSYPVLTCPVLTCPVLTCPVLTCHVLTCSVRTSPMLTFPVQSCPCSGLSCPDLSRPDLSFLILSLF